MQTAVTGLWRSGFFLSVPLSPCVCLCRKIMNTNLHDVFDRVKLLVVFDPGYSSMCFSTRKLQERKQLQIQFMITPCLPLQ